MPSEHKFQESVILECLKIEAFQDNILDEIPIEIVNRLKEKDSHPYIQKYSLCHEGISTPRIIGEESKPIHWTKKAIQSIKNVVLKGVKVFKGHNKDNSTDGRKEIGEIIYDTQQEINGKLNHVIYTYHIPELIEEAKKYDVCSQEANWNFIDAAGRLIADSIEKLTGVAFGISKENKPAFAEAKRLGFIQAFEEPKPPEKQRETLMTYDEIRKNVTFQQLKQLIADFNGYPWQFFTEDDLRNDREFGKVFNENKVLKEANEKLKTDFESQSNSIKEMERKTQISDAKTRLQNIAKDMNLPENRLKFITEQFTENQDDLSDDGLKAFIENQSEVFKKVMEYNNIKVDDIEIPTGDKKGSGLDYTKAENNPLLEEDLEL
jgi:hypothetical protein